MSDYELNFIPGTRKVIIEEIPTDSDESTTGSCSEEDPEAWLETQNETESTPLETLHIQKLIKFLKIGNETASIIALCCLKDQDLTVEANVLAIQNVGGFDTLLNILQARDIKCKLAALQVLRKIRATFHIRKKLTDLGAAQVLVKILDDPARDLRILAAECLSDLCSLRKVRRIVRKMDGIPKIVDMLAINTVYLLTATENLTEDELEWVNIARAGACALWSLSESKRNVQAMCKSGVVALLSQLTKSVHQEIVLPIMATISNCANNAIYRVAYKSENMIPDIIRHLTGDNDHLKMYCARTIFRCAIDDEIREVVRTAGGLDPLIEICADVDGRRNKQLLAAVTGALWSCAPNAKNVDRLDQLGAMQILIDLLEDTDDDVLTNVVGALAELLKFPANRLTLRKADGIGLLVNLLNETHAPLLINLSKALKECATDAECMDAIDKLDGVRLIWSLLKNPHVKVQENAAWALSPCVLNAADSGEIVRSLIGGLELTISLLTSRDIGVLSATCAVLAIISKESENLAIVTELGMIPLLANLVSTTDPQLREHLAEAIANSCSLKSNCKVFGRLGAIAPLVGYLVDPSSKTVHRTAALALYALSENPFNCITMHESGAVAVLLQAVGSQDKELQEAAAGCLRNIRQLALQAEKVHFMEGRVEC